MSARNVSSASMWFSRFSAMNVSRSIETRSRFGAYGVPSRSSTPRAIASWAARMAAPNWEMKPEKEGSRGFMLRSLFPDRQLHTVHFDHAAEADPSASPLLERRAVGERHLPLADAGDAIGRPVELDAELLARNGRRQRQ